MKLDYLLEDCASCDSQNFSENFGGAVFLIELEALWLAVDGNSTTAISELQVGEDAVRKRRARFTGNLRFWSGPEA